ncbi:MAG: amino acid adenylation domain-containing protein, partial [Microcystis sp.]
YTIDHYNLTSEDRVLQITAFSFDVSVWEIFLSLTSGATLVITKSDRYKDIDYLIDLILKEQVTYFTAVPSILRVFLQHPKSKDCHCLKRVIVGGEALSYELNQRFFQQLNCKLYIIFGPTESAVDTTVWCCQPNSQISIGRPLANVQVYILDSYLQPVPIGVAGELHIGGMGLARGYLNQAELTAEKFIPHPFAEGKLYKTGDLARYLPDGNIEYLGRIDNQVKLRGFRIELGEIQTVLETHPNVEQTVVIMREDTLYNQRLVAYVMRKEPLLTSQELRRFLQQKLPVYMIPSAFVMLSDFPLNPNWKIDLHKFPIPDETSLVESPYLAPR